MERKTNLNEMKISSQEKQALLSCSSDIRYKYSIKRIADTEIIWTLGLQDESFAVQKNGNDKFFLVWNSKDFADIFGSKYLKEYVCIPIPLEIFEEKTIDYICESGCLINVFPTQTEIFGKIVDINTFAEDLAKALEEYQ